MTQTETADLVLEGGGVKGIAHIGAITALESKSYRFQRVAGTSAGSIAAAFTAACAQVGKSVAEIEPLMWSGKTADSIDYSKVPGGKLPFPGVEQAREAMSFVMRKGLYSSDYLRNWIYEGLKRVTGIETFGDLKLDDGRKDLADNEKYRLVVMVADISRGSLVRLPWDYHLYGRDPDKELVADAVRASASIPFFFEPVQLKWKNGSRNVSYLVDGGACSDFPIEIFDRLDDENPRWPTFGIKLSARPAPGALINHVTDPLSFATALLETVINGNDQVHLADPCVAERTIFIDTSAVGAENFNLTAAQQQLLFNHGQSAAHTFIDGWNWPTYKGECVGDRGRAQRARAARGGLRPPGPASGIAGSRPAGNA